MRRHFPILFLALIIALFCVPNASATIYWIIAPGSVVCNPVYCSDDVQGAVGGQYSSGVYAVCGNCFLNGSGIAHRGYEIPVEEFPFAYANLYANCTTYNPTLLTSILEQPAGFDYIDDFGDLNIADGLKGLGIATGSPWWSPIYAPVVLYKMFTESDCYSDATRIIAPPMAPC